MVLEDFRLIDNFTPKEFEKVGGYEHVDAHIVHLADQVRNEYGRPLVLTSAYREGDSGEHGPGKALDLKVLRRDREHYHMLLMACFRFRCGGLGVYDTWRIHIDNRSGNIGARWIEIDHVEYAWTFDNLRTCIDRAQRNL